MRSDDDDTGSNDDADDHDNHNADDDHGDGNDVDNVVNNVCWVRRRSCDSDGGALGTHHYPYRLCNIIMIMISVISNQHDQCDQHDQCNHRDCRGAELSLNKTKGKMSKSLIDHSDLG